MTFLFFLKLLIYEPKGLAFFFLPDFPSDLSNAESQWSRRKISTFIRNKKRGVSALEIISRIRVWCVSVTFHKRRAAVLFLIQELRGSKEMYSLINIHFLILHGHSVLQ